MAQIETSLYATLAELYANIDDELASVEVYAKQALEAVVDVDTDTGPDPSDNANYAIQVELALLTPFNSAYNTAQQISNGQSGLLSAVRALNNFVVANSTETGTAAAKLTTWINTTMSGSWSGSQCPEGWANLSSAAGYDVSEWGTE